MPSGKDASNNDNNTPPLPARPASAAPLAPTLSSDKDKDDDRVQQDKGNSLPAAAIDHPELGSAGVGPADK
ncbi:hypothetical protein BGX30_002059, partial [Mortierella sp. GBA39]